MALTRQVEEVVLLKYSLLSEEILEFDLPSSEDLNAWTQIVDTYNVDDFLSSHVSCHARFTIKIRGIPLWFEVELPDEYPLKTSEFLVTVRGYDISKAEQQRWQDIVRNKRAQLSEVDFPAYELISLHLLPLLHAEYDPHKSAEATHTQETSMLVQLPHERIFHALLTSHHLKSPQKRRLLQQWSSELRLCGFAKVGHPGVIYCSGTESMVEEFVSKVKDMQWLALKVRFMNALPGAAQDAKAQLGRGSWLEVEKVGEVVDEMRKLGRERYVLDLGIGSGGAK